jgi:hypothetical protein
MVKEFRFILNFASTVEDYDEFANKETSLILISRTRKRI